MLPTWLPKAVLLCTAAGPISHYAFWVRHEFDGVIHRFVPVILLSQVLLLGLIYVTGVGLSQSVFILSLLQISYLVPLFLSIAVYRLFLHPTRRFPGPFWARLSSWWKVHTFIAHNEQGYAVVHELHQQYGDVVRLGKIHIMGLSFLFKPLTEWKDLAIFPSGTSTPSHRSMAPVLFASSRPAMNFQKKTTSKRFETPKSIAIAESCGTKHSAQEVTSVIDKTVCLWADSSKSMQ